MNYAKDAKKTIGHTAVTQLIQPKKYSGLNVGPPTGTVVQAKPIEDRIIQQKSTGTGVSTTVPTTAPDLAIDPPKPGINKTGFIDNDDGANIRTRPAESGGKVLTTQPLPPATRVFVGGSHPEAPQWWYVNAYCPNMIVRGYVQQFRIATELPEPGAKLCQLEEGDTVEELARREFATAVRDGHDLRYYENVLLYVNLQAGRNGIKGTYQNPDLWGGGANNIQLIAGKRIWLASPSFAKRLESIVPSGSFTGGAVAKAGRIYGHLQDIVQSVIDSPQYFLEVAGEYAAVIYEHLPEIIATVAGFILAESLSASLAASPTGVGQLAAVLIQLILALLGVQALVESLGQALDHAGKWLQLAWAASGDPHKLGEASKEFLRMLVSIALAALSVLGIKGNLGKGLKIANAVKIEPPSLGMSPALVTPSGQVMGGGVMIYPGSITSTGPVDLGMFNVYNATGASGTKVIKGTQGSATKTGSKLKLRTAKDLRGKTDGGPGVWEESPKRTKGVEYQEQISGVERGTEYKVEEVWFDGYDSKRKVLLDAKDWEKWPPADKDFWHESVRQEARRQIEAANGTLIEWHVSTSEKAAILDAFLKSNKLPIKVVYTPQI